MEDTKGILLELIETAVAELTNAVTENLFKMNFSEIVKLTQKTMNELGTRIIEKIVFMADERYDLKRNKHEIILRHRK